MIRIRRVLLGIVAAPVLFGAPAAARDPSPGSAAPPTIEAENALETASVPGLPVIGKWMIGPDGTIAHWLGEIVDGKQLREPINIIIVDRVATTPGQAIDRLTSAATAAGYPPRKGHSTGYRALIGGTLFAQIPSGSDLAFSNGTYLMNNNHGRIFGPFRFDGGFVFTGALSRELVRVAGEPHHVYGSFNQARDDFARNLDLKTGFKIAAFVPLDNAITEEASVGTGDHDGVAILLEAKDSTVGGTDKPGR